MPSLSDTAAEVMGEKRPPPVVWVANTPLTDALTMPHDGPPVDLGGDFDWALAAGDEQLGLIRLSPVRPSRGELVLGFDWAEIDVDVEDFGGALDRRRVFLITLEDGRWIALGAPLTSAKRRAELDAFTEVLLERARAGGADVGPGPDSAVP